MNQDQMRNLNPIDIEKLHLLVKDLERREKELTRKLRLYETLNSKILDALPINIFLEDRAGRTIFANEHACKSNGMSREELVGKTVFDFFPPSIAEKMRKDDLEVWQQKNLITKEVIVGFQGKESFMFTGKSIILLQESKEEFLLGFGLDITDRVNAEQLLRESEEKFRNLIEQAADSFFLIQSNGKLSDVNSMACKVLGFTKEEILVKKTEELFPLLQEKIDTLESISSDSKTCKYEDYMISRNNKKIPVDINLQQITIHSKKMYLALCRDISEKKEAQEKIKHMAYHDALTSLPNRWFIQSFFQKYISKHQNERKLLGVLLLDLDRFKVINDSLGHQAGDILLQEVSKRLQSAVGKREILARLGGDEFILLLPDLKSENDAILICDTIMKKMEAPFYIQNQKFNITTSIGVSLCPNDGHDIHTLIKNADLAMYRSKDQGKNCYTFFDSSMKESAVNRMDLEILLHQAIKNEEFILHYQPKLNIITGKIEGMEALIRWKHPNKTILYPDSFIKIAEETGLIVPIGEWVIREACRQCKEWQNSGLDHLSVSVNLSPRQFQKQNLVKSISDILAETELPSHCLELELTEGTVMQNPTQTAAMLNSLKSLGVRISIDDFGTGFSSLGYLKYFPIDTLKIDKSFIMNLEWDQANAAIASAVISMAHSLGLKVVAEGVETEEQLNFLKLGGCDLAQGYLISKPISAQDFFFWLKNNLVPS